MLLPAIPKPVVKRRFLQQSLRFQALCTLLLAGILPLSVSGFAYSPSAETSTNSLAFSVAASLIALLMFRRVTAYPGVRGFAYILPTYSLTYGLGIAAMLFARTSYSGSMLLVAYTATIAFAFLITYYSERTVIQRFFVVPGGNAAQLAELSNVDWVWLDKPELPEDRDWPIVADLRADHDPAWERMLALAALDGRAVYHTKQLRESLTGRVQIEHLSENSLGSLVPNLAYGKVKRFAELVLCVALLPAILLVCGLIALAIRMDSPGPVLFRQQRMGSGARPFEMLKFRTMLHREQALTAEAARLEAMTRDGDDRITRVGKLLRRTRLDELPQLLNVLGGHMSIIGPRPEAIPLSQWYEAELPFYVYRHIVRPGITGWAQVNQGHVAELEDVHRKLNYDFYYIKNFSAWLDMVIALRTVSIMLSGLGAR
jgi:lipopolysaccharide/colanic/teichoic acid biosynthesis glycosyltransferase